MDIQKILDLRMVNGAPVKDKTPHHFPKPSKKPSVRPQGITFTQRSDYLDKKKNQQHEPKKGFGRICNTKVFRKPTKMFSSAGAELFAAEMLNKYADSIQVTKTRYMTQAFEKQNPRLWIKIPRFCQDVLCTNYEVNIYSSTFDREQAVLGRITFLPKFPHFLFWYEVDCFGKAVGEKHNFCLELVYQKVLKREQRGFCYGEMARELAPYKMFHTDYVFYIEGPRYKLQPRETIWIEFLDAFQYAQWRNSVMFLIKTTMEGYLGIRDPARDMTKKEHQLQKNEKLGNIIDIQCGDKNESWKDLMLSTQKNDAITGQKWSNTEFIMLDLAEANSNQWLTDTLIITAGKLTKLNQSLLQQFLCEQKIIEMSINQNKVEMEIQKNFGFEPKTPSGLDPARWTRPEEYLPYLPTFSHFRFLFKQYRNIVKAFKTIEIPVLYQRVKKCQKNLRWRQERGVTVHPCEQSMKLVLAQRAVITYSLAKLAEGKELDRKEKQRKGRHYQQSIVRKLSTQTTQTFIPGIGFINIDPNGDELKSIEDMIVETKQRDGRMCTRDVCNFSKCVMF